MEMVSAKPQQNLSLRFLPEMSKEKLLHDALPRIRRCVPGLWISTKGLHV